MIALVYLYAFIVAALLILGAVFLTFKCCFKNESTATSAPKKANKTKPAQNDQVEQFDPYDEIPTDVEEGNRSPAPG